MLDQLETVQKSTFEKERLMAQAFEDKQALNSGISYKEQQLRRVKESLDANAAQTQAVTSR